MHRFIHAADIHLDSPLRGLEKYEGAPVSEIRGATRRALENLVALAIDRKVDFVLIAGDLYDGDWKDHNTGLFFVAQMRQLRDAGIPVVMISGNHDAANKMTLSLRLPDNVELLAHDRPATARLSRLEELGVAIHGQSFRNAAEFDNLVPAYPSKKTGLLNIGLLHTSLDGAEGHERYAPCTLDHLRQREYDYWALGHVHNREVRHSAPPIVFPGNTQGRHIREAGPKGCYVVTVDAQHRCELEFVPLDVFRWATCVLNATDAQRPDDVCDRFQSELGPLVQPHGELPLAVRVEIVGNTSAHQMLLADPIRWSNELRSIAEASTNGRVWVEQIKWRTSPMQTLNEALDRASPLAALANCLEELRSDATKLAEIAQVLSDLQRKLPDELVRGDEAIRFADPDQLRQWLDETEPLLMSRLQVGGNS